MKKIGYLGPPGTFSEMAARRYLGDTPAELVDYPTLADVLSAVESGELHEGIVPLENSSEGPVGITMDLLANGIEVRIKGEVIIPVTQHLLTRSGVELKSVIRVLSHPQAIAQARNCLNKLLPGVNIAETNSTAEAARMVADTSYPWAAIGTDLAAKTHGLEVLCEAINDCPDNTTRFVVVGPRDQQPVALYEASVYKTSVVISIIDRPGALYSILREFALRDINLTSIESRPARNRLGDYLFFIDLIGNCCDSHVQEVLQAISEQAVKVKVLGSYPADPNGMRDYNAALTNLAALEQVRMEIDIIDAQIVDLLAKRIRMAARAGNFKPGPTQIRDKGREEQVIARVRQLAGEKGIDPEVVETIYHRIIHHSVNLQLMAKIKSGYPK